MKRKCSIVISIIIDSILHMSCRKNCGLATWWVQSKSWRITPRIIGGRLINAR